MTMYQDAAPASTGNLTESPAEPAPKRRKTICRKVQRSGFTHIPNETVRDSKLSLQARGGLAFILSLPDDWEFHKDWFERENDIGSTKGDAIFKELENCGYCRRWQVRLPNGRAGPWEYLFFDVPMARQPSDTKAAVPRRGAAKTSPQPRFPVPVEPQPGFPEPENHPPTNTESLRILNQTKTEEEGAQARLPAADVDLFGKQEKTAKRVRRTKMAKGAVLTEELLAVALANGLTEPQAETAWRKFVAHGVSTSRPSADWGEEWIKWVLNEPRYVGRSQRRENPMMQAMRELESEWVQ